MFSTVVRTTTGAGTAAGAVVLNFAGTAGPSFVAVGLVVASVLIDFVVVVVVVVSGGCFGAAVRGGRPFGSTACGSGAVAPSHCPHATGHFSRICSASCGGYP